MIRITFKRKCVFYPIECNLTVTKEEFENPTEENTFFAMAYASSALKITNKIISECDDDFSFEDFADKYYHLVFGRPNKVGRTNKISQQTIDDIFQMYFKENPVEESTKASYLCCLQWIHKYGGNDTKLYKIDEDYVRNWKSFVNKTFKSEKGRPISINTFGMYIGGFKAVWNFARMKAKKSGEELPDLASVLKRPASPRQNTSVSIPDLRKFLSATPGNEEEELGRDFFLLSVLLSGANLGDIFSLRNSNIRGDKLTFVRNKTKRSGVKTEMLIPSEAMAIIKKYGELKPKQPKVYIFPFYQETMSSAQLLKKKRDCIKKINRGCKKLCARIGIPEFTSKYARHSFATYGRDIAGLSVEQIQKFLGHTSSQTTQRYLDSLTTKTQEKNRDFLNSFASDLINGRDPQH